LKKENLEAFIEKFAQFVCQNIDDEDFIPEIEADMELDLGDITNNFMSNLKRFAPFGPENMAPIFMSTSVVEEGNGKIVGDKHIKMRLLYRNKSSQPIEAIAFNQKKHFDHIANQKDFDILYHVEENTWNNVTNIQLNIKDIRINL